MQFPDRPNRSYGRHRKSGRQRTSKVKNGRFFQRTVADRSGVFNPLELDRADVVRLSRLLSSIDRLIGVSNWWAHKHSNLGPAD